VKILITTDLFTTATNGVVTSIKNLFDVLKSKGHEVRILTLSENTRSHQDGTIYYIRSMPIGIYPNIRMPLSYRHSYIKKLIDWKPDIIHSQCEVFSMQFAKRISKMTGAPIVHTYHTMYEQYIGYVLPGKRFGKWVVQRLVHKRLKDVALVIVPTIKIEQNLKEMSLEKPIKVIPSGISLEQFKSRLPAETRQKMRAELGISQEQDALVYLGRLGTEKNLDELLFLFSKAHSFNDKLVFLIVGDGPERMQLKKKANSLGIASSVIFTGMVKPTEVQNYYQLGDVFVSASTSETQGLTYIEAAVSGLPLVCRQDPCLENVIIQGENGFEYSNEKEFIDAINLVCNSSEWRANAGRKSEEIASVFDKTSFGASVEEVYISTLRGVKNPPNNQ